jgi:hypothetical protein
LSDRRHVVTDADRDSQPYVRIDGAWQDLTTQDLTVSGDWTITGDWTFTGTTTLAEDYAELGTLTQTDTYLFLNRTDASNPALYVVQAGAGSVASFGVGSIGSTTLDPYVLIGQGDIEVASTVGDASIHLKADTSNTVETSNPYIRFEQDGNAVQAIIGCSGATDVDAEGNTMTNAGNNGFNIHMAYASGTIGLGVGGSSAMRITSANDARFYGDLYPAGGQATGRFVDMPSSSYGSVCVDGSEVDGTWEGYNVNGRGVFMWHPTSERGGIYDDVNNCWVLQWNADNDSSSEKLSLYTRDNTTSLAAARTQDHTLAGNSTSFEIRNSNGTFYDAGMNQMPRTITNASATLSNEDAGGCFYSNNSTTYTITLNNQTDFPVEGCFFILNYGTGSVTIAPGTGSLLWPNGSSNSGTRTVGPYSVATIFHYSAGTWFIWGDSIS